MQIECVQYEKGLAGLYRALFCIKKTPRWMSLVFDAGCVFCFIPEKAELRSSVQPYREVR